MTPQPKTCYRFGEFLLSPPRRQLLKSGREVPLIPRYLDLLIVLVERRHEAVHRREIFDSVWSDVVVSDGALSQAVRTLRRALGDDPRDPAFIRTVSRHGYRFVFEPLVEESDDGAGGRSAPAPPPRQEPAPEGPFEEALRRLLQGGPGSDPEGDERREAAETLHSLGTAEALRRLDRRPGHEVGRALLRDARWDVPGAGPVPWLGQPGALKTLAALVEMRLRRALRIARARWASAAVGGGVAGVLAGLLGGTALCLADPQTPWSVPVALALVAAIIGGVGAAGVGAGLAAAEVLARSARGVALVALGALGGGLVGAVSHLLGRWTLEGLFGHPLGAVGGGVEGVVLGGACGLGYSLSTPTQRGGGMASPHGRARLVSALATGAASALGCAALAWAGGHPAGESIDFIARSFQGSKVGLAPLARLMGETGLGPVTRTVVSLYEGAWFGAGLALGLTRRLPPRSA